MRRDILHGLPPWKNRNLSHMNCDVLMLEMNEKMLTTLPKFLLHALGKACYCNMSRGAAKRIDKKYYAM
jgi:hypothetical protein